MDEGFINKKKPKIVIGSPVLLELGKVYEGLRNQEGTRNPGQRFCVTKEATREDWINSVISFGGQSPKKEDLREGYYFYEISTD
jgi:hypothetical protein